MWTFSQNTHAPEYLNTIIHIHVYTQWKVNHLLSFIYKHQLIVYAVPDAVNALTYNGEDGDTMSDIGPAPGTYSDNKQSTKSGQKIA